MAARKLFVSFMVLVVDISLDNKKHTDLIYSVNIDKLMTKIIGCM